MNTNRPSERGRAWPNTFAMPAVIALVSLVGLLAALVGDGLFDVLSWLALGTVLAALAWAALFRRQ
ncbi:MAG: hypothetical protein LKM32_07810 [Chiayiivirga sp.]|uniref:hypothetical protein n=1 Tax=Chiayiivirga sp. TaxID=2041042 RepID=UPI0025C11511|nr:hypothetical protein [Chiayiivirga sp.]MCI1729268.1 hypothetical protein [Chiayiivirga sp.]